MVIRWAAIEDVPGWRALSREYDALIAPLTSDLSGWYDGFDQYMERKIANRNALAALDGEGGALKGMIAFSTAYGRITFFAVARGAAFDQVADLLLCAALAELGERRDISAWLPQPVHPHLAKAVSAFERHGFAGAEAGEDAGVSGIRFVRAN